MPDRFKSVDRRTFNSYYDLMQALMIEGFDNEFDNSLVMRVLSERVEAIWETTGKKSGVYVRTLCEHDPKHGCILKVNLRSSVLERAQETIVLFVRTGGALSVSTNVMQDKPMTAHMTHSGSAYQMVAREDLAGVTRQWESDLPHHAHSLLENMFSTLSPKDYPNQCLVNLTKNKKELQADFTVSSILVAELRIPLKKKV